MFQRTFGREEEEEIFYTPQGEVKEGGKWGADSGGGCGEELGKNSSAWGTLTQTHCVSHGALSVHSLWAPVFGEVGSGVQLPTSLALSSRTLGLGEAEDATGQPPCSHAQVASTRPL